MASNAASVHEGVHAHSWSSARVNVGMFKSSRTHGDSPNSVRSADHRGQDTVDQRGRVESNADPDL